MELDKETMKKIRSLIVFTVLLLVCVWKYEMVGAVLSYILNIISPFLLGGAIAFVLNVPMCFVERKLFRERKYAESKIGSRLARPVSLILTLIFVFGMIILVLFVVVPQLTNTFNNLGESMQAFLPKIQEWVEAITDNEEIVAWVSNLQFNWQKILEFLLDFFKKGAGSMVDSTVAVARSVISGLATFFIAFSFSCYVLVQKERLRVQVEKVLFAFVPRRKAEVVLEICSLTYKTFSSFLTGQCLEAVILGCMFFVTMTILRMPYALLVSILIAFTALIPVFGAFIGCAVGAFMIFMVNPMQAIGFVVMFLILQQIEGNLIYPHVVGNSVGLPSIWVLAAVTIGGNLMGIAGMLIFIPIVSVLYALFREVVYLKLKKRQMEEEQEKQKENMGQ